MNVYEIVTQKILEKIDEGVVPWRKPWSNLGPQQNYVTKRHYRGMNQFLLNMSEHGMPYWLTYRQAKDLGNVIKREELSKNNIAVFWKWIKKKNRLTGQVELNDDGEPIMIPFLRFYKIWNVEQTTLEVEYEVPTFEHTPIERCEEIVKGYENKPKIEILGGRACYNPLNDRVKMPPMKLFKKAEEYYSTLFHELGHSTGHSNRLNRDFNGMFGSDPYAREELVAEMTSGFLCGIVNIDCLDNSAAYIDGWRKKINEDTSLVVTAAAQAQKAADWILGQYNEQEEE